LAERSLLAWVRLLSQKEQIGVTSLETLPAKWATPALKDLRKYLNEPDIPIQETGWWFDTRERRLALAQVFLALGQELSSRGPEFVEKCWNVGLGVVENDYQEPETLELNRQLALLYVHNPDLEKSQEKLNELIDKIFSGKIAAIETGDFEAEQRFHTALGMIFAQEGVWGSDNNPRGASYQLRRAVEVANDRYRTEGFYQPLPEIKKLKAEVYSTLKDRDNASLALWETVLAYLDADQLDEASTTLEELPNEPTRDTSSLRRILNLRRNAAQAYPDSKDLRLLNEPKPGISLDFLERQKFKILGDALARPHVGDDKVFLSSALGVYHLAIKKHLPLVSIRDLLRWRAVESTLAASIRSPAAPDSFSYLSGHLPATLTLALPGVTISRAVSLNPHSIVGAKVVDALGVENVVRWKPYIEYDGSRLRVPEEFGPNIQKLEAAGIRLSTYYSGKTFIAPSPQPVSPSPESRSSLPPPETQPPESRNFTPTLEPRQMYPSPNGSAPSQSCPVPRYPGTVASAMDSTGCGPTGSGGDEAAQNQAKNNF
jgi:hypothetical protein